MLPQSYGHFDYKQNRPDLILILYRYVIGATLVSVPPDGLHSDGRDDTPEAAEPWENCV